MANRCPGILPGHPIWIPTRRRAYELARWFRTRVVILGGLHALSVKQRSNADIVAVGDGVVLWPRILRDVETSQYEPTAQVTGDPTATTGCYTRIGICTTRRMWSFARRECPPRSWPPVTPGVTNGCFPMDPSGVRWSNSPAGGTWDFAFGCRPRTADEAER